MIKASLYDINKAIEANNVQECPLEKIVHEQYRKFLSQFGKILTNWLPPHRSSIDHEVRLKEEDIPMWGLLYSM